MSARGPEPKRTPTGVRAMVGLSDGREQTWRVEDVIPLAEGEEDAGFRDEERGVRRVLIPARRAPGPVSQTSFEGPGRDRRDRRLSRAPSPQAGAPRRRRGERIRRYGEVSHQGPYQRCDPDRIAPGRDEMRATRIRDGRREQDERHERRDGPCGRREQMPGRTGSHHSSVFVVRFPPPPGRGASSRGDEVEPDPGR
jgi:hypothetical protein